MPKTPLVQPLAPQKFSRLARNVERMVARLWLDDSTYLHYTENTTTDDRLILFCDVERPLIKTKALTAINRWVSKHISMRAPRRTKRTSASAGLTASSATSILAACRQASASLEQAVPLHCQYLAIGGVLPAFLAPAFG